LIDNLRRELRKNMKDTKVMKTIKQIVDTIKILKLRLEPKSKLKIIALYGIPAILLLVLALFLINHYRFKRERPNLNLYSSPVLATAGAYQMQQFMPPVVAKKQPFSNTLYFAGKIQPSKRVSVVSPVDGVVKRAAFIYGDEIKEKQLMFEINSPKHQQIFQEILTRYLKSKQDVGLLEAKVKSSTELYKQGIIPKDELTEINKNYYLNKLAFLQEKNNLDMVLKYHPDITDVSKLSINDTDIVTKIVEISAQTEDVSIFAPKDGVILFPEGREDEFKVKDGSEVRNGQVLAYIGDISSLIVKIEINESNIYQIKVGEEATVTSNAFPDLRLAGRITNIDSQAIGHQDLPIFTAIVTVPAITEEQKKIIRVGMGVKVSVTFEHDPQVLVPVDAVIHDDGKSKVKVIDESGQVKEANVTVGGTTADSAVITSGINEGDKVVTSNPIK
jgi:HlyD family secretion protein